ncbi:MAG: leucyl aminopeptidase, partial [Thermomicrobiales bacterium]|nr:leucyl aminopeptidase [Thermomicrobiales bacterium]
ALVVPTLGQLPARRVVLAGVGPTGKLNAEAIRRAWGAAATSARDAGAARIVSALPPADDVINADRALAAAVEGARLATYRFTRYYGQARKDDPAPRAITSLTFAGDGLDVATGQSAIARGEAAAAAVELARDLSNEPASVLNPEGFAEHARRVAKEHGLEITVIGPAEMERLGMGAISVVGRGSANEPRLIHLVYRPEGATESTRQLGYVGKAITFDTGGYSIKPYEGMLEMKGDMAGGAAVLGAMSALRPLGVRHVVHGVICAAENMISGEAFRPGDILTAMNGVTIEILSTDAEGRLVLADGLVYAARQGAQELIDLATLTGAKVVALGDETVALFSNDDALAGRLLAAAGEAGERMWRMPLTEEMKDQIKGEVGDIKNTGGRAGGAITAALFIEHFAEGLPWAHLDIAGSNRANKSRPYTPKGATGVGVRTLLEYATAGE